MPELLAEFDPPGEHLSEFAAGFVGCGAKGGCTRAFWVLGPPADEDSVVISDFFGGGTRERSIQPALQWKLVRGPRHARIVALATHPRPWAQLFESATMRRPAAPALTPATDG